MGRYPFRLVTFDLDGTLTREHGWLAIARATGRVAEYEQSHRAFLAGTRGEEGHLDDLLALAVGRRVDEVEAILAATPKIGGLPETVRALHADGVRLALLTHNPDYVCRWYARTFGFEDFEGTVGERVRDGRVVDAGPAHPDKVAGLLRLRDRAGVPARAIAHIGDGRADAAVFPHVGFGLAFRAARAEVRRAADAVVGGDDLAAVLPVLADARPRTPVNDAPPPR